MKIYNKKTTQEIDIKNTDHYRDNEKIIINYDVACKISDHLLKTNQGFCFYNGVIISKKDCEDIINDYNTLK
jgi:hypothetical protein